MWESVFEVDTLGTCLFCLDPNCAPLDKTNFDLRASTAIKMLFRYLNIDIRKVASVSKAGGITLNASTHLSVTLCDSCFLLVDEFLGLFQDFERIRLMLEGCTWKLHECIRKGSKSKIEDGGLVRKPQNVMMNSGGKPDVKFAEELRRETFEKCTEKHRSSIPRICLTKRATFTRMERNDLELQNSIEEGGRIPGGITSEDLTFDHVEVKVEDEDIKPSWSDLEDDDTPSTFEHVQLRYPTADINEVPGETRTGDILPTTHLAVPQVRTTMEATRTTTCDNSFSGDTTLLQHIRDQVPSSSSKNPKLKCVYCSQYYSRRQHLIAHQYGLHPRQMLSEILPAHVSELDVKRGVESILSMNYGTHSAAAQSDRHRTCPLCGKVSHNSSKVRVHILRFHKDHVCQKIGSFQQTLALGPGMSDPSPPPQIKMPRRQPIPRGKPSDTPSKSANIPCDICGTKFRYLRYLREHKARAHSHGVFVCNLCDKVFVTENRLQVHRRKFHMENLLRKTWKCDHCQGLFATGAGLRRHRDAIHTMLTFADRIPAGISEQVFESCLAALIEKNQPVGNVVQNFEKADCLLCGKTLSCETSYLRLHIVRFHLEKVIENALKR